MIDEKKLIEELIPILNEHGDMYFAGRILGTIDMQPQADKWIPCSEREPNDDELNEAYCRNIYGSEFNVMIEGATKPTTLKYTRNGLWIDQNSKIYDVIAWQPLPAPYKKEGAE